MLDLIKGKKYLDKYYNALFFTSDEETLYKRLDIYINQSGESVTEFMKCLFASMYEKGEDGYFADSGVLYHLEYPMIDGVVDILLTNEEFYAIVSRKYLDYCDKHPEIDKDKVEKLLSKVKESLKNNYAEEATIRR